MGYAQGDLIQATDFNGLASTTIGGNVAWVWGTGWQRAGYGQDTTFLSSVTASSTVTATQWAGLVYTINRALGHQGQTQLGGGVGGANINMTAGQTITYFANVASAVGAPLLPTLRIRSGVFPAAFCASIRFFFAAIFAYKPIIF